jgi:S1-C subfamily serine protease
MLPVFQAQPGFRGYSLVDSDGEVISITSWDSAADADEASALAAEWIAENLAAEIELKEVRVGEILFSTVFGVSLKTGATG